MSNNICKFIRSQIEEQALRDDYGQSVRVHLNECESCRQFEKEQRSLRELVGSLGTVQAPADFDFKLRARMADRSSRRMAGLRWSLNPLIATAAAILLFSGVIAGIVYVNKNSTNESVTSAPPSSSPVPIVSLPATSNQTIASKPNNDATSEDPVRDVRKERVSKKINDSVAQSANKPKRSMSVAEFSGTGAFGPTTQFNSSRVFPIDASLNSMKVSLDDGRGNARTISLPGISFGSQRVVASGSQPQQKGLW